MYPSCVIREKSGNLVFPDDDVHFLNRLNVALLNDQDLLAYEGLPPGFPVLKLHCPAQFDRQFLEGLNLCRRL